MNDECLASLLPQLEGALRLAAVSSVKELELGTFSSPCSCVPLSPPRSSCSLLVVRSQTKRTNTLKVARYPSAPAMHRGHHRAGIHRVKSGLDEALDALRAEQDDAARECSARVAAVQHAYQEELAELTEQFEAQVAELERGTRAAIEELHTVAQQRVTAAASALLEELHAAAAAAVAPEASHGHEHQQQWQPASAAADIAQHAASQVSPAARCSWRRLPHGAGELLVVCSSSSSGSSGGSSPSSGRRRPGSGGRPPAGACRMDGQGTTAINQQWSISPCSGQKLVAPGVGVSSSRRRRRSGRGERDRPPQHQQRQSGKSYCTLPPDTPLLACSSTGDAHAASPQLLRRRGGGDSGLHAAAGVLQQQQQRCRSQQLAGGGAATSRSVQLAVAAAATPQERSSENAARNNLTTASRAAELGRSVASLGLRRAAVAASTRASTQPASCNVARSAGTPAMLQLNPLYVPPEAS